LQVFAEIEKNFNTNPNDYVDEHFLDKKNAWKNRYQHRSHLETGCDGTEHGKLALHPRHLLEQKEVASVTAYKTPIDICSYGNLDEIEAHNKREILAIQARRRRHDFEYEDEGEWPLEDNCLSPVHLTIIGETAVPVKFRVEIVDEREYFGIVEKMYCNLRILAFNEKNHLWDVSSCIYIVQTELMSFVTTSRPLSRTTQISPWKKTKLIIISATL
jgi:hypothetical protein